MPALKAANSKTAKLSWTAQRLIDRKLSLRFVGRFLVIVCILFGLADTPLARRAYQVCARVEATAAATLLNCAGQHVHTIDVTIVSTRFAVTVGPECTGSEIACVLVAVVCAFPAGLAQKLAGIVFAILGVEALNVCRLASIFIVGLCRLDWFDVCHKDIWSGLNCLGAAIIALLWIGWAARCHGEQKFAATVTMSSAKVMRCLGRFTFWLAIACVVWWLGLSEPCGAMFRAIQARVFYTTKGFREIDVERLDSRNTRIEIVNRRLMNQDGSGPVRNLDMNTFGVWLPVLVYVALVLAVPLSWQRRSLSLAFGLFLLQGLLLLMMGFAVWNNSTEVQLVNLSQFWKNAADGIQGNLQGFIYLAAPMLLWTLSCFRQSDFVCVPTARKADKKSWQFWRSDISSHV